MQDAPLDILYSIFKHVDPLSLIRVRSTCRNFKAATTASTISRADKLATIFNDHFIQNKPNINRIKIAFMDSRNHVRFTISRSKHESKARYTLGDQRTYCINPLFDNLVANESPNIIEATLYISFDKRDNMKAVYALQRRLQDVFNGRYVFIYNV